MSKQPKNHTIMCPACAEALDVGDETRTVVAFCFKRNWSCPGKQWASAATRFNYGEVREADGKTGYTHIIQTDPPVEEEVEQAAA
jgi:hypothetical protein